MLTNTAVALPPKQRTRGGRRLVLVDVENVAGGPAVESRDVSRLRARLEKERHVGADDHVVVASAHANGLNAWVGWGGTPRRLVRSGPDGADLALLEVLKTERIAERFAYVTIVSGDGIFTDAVSALAAHGIEVAVVAREGHCSKRLRLAADHVALWRDEMTLSKEAA